MFVGFVVGARRGAAARRASTSLFDSNSEPLGVLLAAAAIISPSGFIDDIKEISAAGQGDRHGRRRARARAGSASTMFYFRLPFVDGPIVLSDDWIPLITVLWLLGISQAINLIDGLDGLAAGIVAIAAGAFFLYSQQARPTLGLLDPAATSARCWRSSPSGCASASCRTTSTRRGSSWATAARCCSACCSPCRRASSAAAPTRASEFIGQTYFFLAPLVHPAVHPRRADPRHAVRHRPPRRPTPGARHGRQGPPPPPPDEPRPRPPPQRADPVGVDGAAVGVRALSGAHRVEPGLPAVRHGRPRHRAVHVLHPSVRGAARRCRPRLPVATAAATPDVEAALAAGRDDEAVDASATPRSCLTSDLPARRSPTRLCMRSQAASHRALGADSRRNHLIWINEAPPSDPPRRPSRSNDPRAARPRLRRGHRDRDLLRPRLGARRCLGTRPSFMIVLTLVRLSSGCSLRFWYRYDDTHDRTRSERAATPHGLRVGDDAERRDRADELAMRTTELNSSHTVPAPTCSRCVSTARRPRSRSPGHDPARAASSARCSIAVCAVIWGSAGAWSWPTASPSCSSTSLLAAGDHRRRRPHLARTDDGGHAVRLPDPPRVDLPRRVARA